MVDIREHKISDPNFFKTILEHSNEGISVLDKEGKVIYQSPSNHKILGYNESEITALNYFDLIHPDNIEEAQHLYREIYKVPEKIFSIELKLKHKRGDYIDLELEIVNLLHNMTITGVVVNFRDISEKKVKERELEKLTNDLARRNRELKDFSYITTHNLRSPIANLIGLCRLMNEKELSPIASQIMSKIKFLVNQIDNNLNDLLDSLVSINSEEQVTQVDFYEMYESVLSEIEHLIIEAEPVFEVDLNEVERIDYIKSHIHNIFINMITNSIKYRDPAIPLKIRISTRRDENYTILEFEDNGIGINLAENRDKIFKIYHRLGTHKGITGKGLGLYLVKTQIEQHKGAIEVESTVGKGTKFRIFLKDKRQ